MSKKILKEKGNLNKLQQLENRVERLEKIVFGKSFNKGKSIKVKTSFSGAIGGLRLLISQHFFDQKKTFAEIKEGLAKRGYYYSNQAVQTPLNNLSKSGGPLVAFKERGKKVYARRK